MKKLILPVLFILLGFIGTTAQKRLNFESKPMSLAVPRVNNNEAVVIISAPDIYQLNFESTMDKTVNVYNTVNESSYNYYFLKFIVGEIYKDRKIEIKVDGYDKTVIAVPLTAKEVQSFYVYDPDGTVGVGCYFKNRNEGNGYYEKAMYSEAREKYNLALICSDTPVDNDLKKRIEDSEMCTFLRRKADNSFSEGKYEEAEEYYKEVLSLNVNDEYCKTRIKDSQNAFASICRRVQGTVTDKNNKPLEKVEISGAIKVDKNKYEGEKSLGFTDENGHYDLLVRQQYNALEFSGSLYKKVIMEIPKNEVNEINVALKPSGASIGLGIGTEILKEYINSKSNSSGRSTTYPSNNSYNK